MAVTISKDFNPVPSVAKTIEVEVTSKAKAAAGAAVSIGVSSSGDVAKAAGFSRKQLEAAGFTGALNSTLVLPGSSTTVLVGTGEGSLTIAQVRDLAAAVARAAAKSAELVLDLTGLSGEDTAEIAQAAVEGAVLARYRYNALKREPKTVELAKLTLVVDRSARRASEAGALVGLELARATSLARDLANTPPRHLTAARFADVIAELSPKFGLKAKVFGPKELTAMGCGGVLGVNAGSVEEPRIVELTYKPRRASGHLALVGKGIMYDSGGISLKPNNPMHTHMKLDMAGAAAVFSAMTALKALGASTAVTAYLLCTDNMPSGSATKLGDVLTIRGGKTVEVKNTDAEGRLVLADGLTLATELKPDAIVDIATLTGAAMAALGHLNAAVFANNDDILQQVEDAARATDETVWHMPLDHRYRDSINSEIADLKNMGGEYGGAVTAALFLNEFVDSIPWAHLDMAATMRSETDSLWKALGATGYGTRLLAQLAANFKAPESAKATK